MVFSVDFVRKYVVQKEGTFLKGFPIKKIYIWILFSIALFGVILSLCIFLHYLIAENTADYGILVGFSLLFIILTIPAAIILLWYNHKINSVKKKILSDDNLISTSVVPHKIFIGNNINRGFKLQIEFEYEGNKVKLISGKYPGEHSIIPLNRETTIVYSPLCNDAVIYKDGVRPVLFSQKNFALLQFFRGPRHK